MTVVSAPLTNSQIDNLFQTTSWAAESGAGPGGSIALGMHDHRDLRQRPHPRHYGNDVLCGLGGNDVLNGAKGHDLIDTADGVYYEGWKPSKTPETYRDRGTFLARLAEGALLAGETEASLTAEGASRVLRQHVSAGEFADVLEMLPADVRALL